MNSREASTKYNTVAIIIYALAIAAALGLNDLILAIFNKVKFFRSSEILSKAIYVILMFVCVLLIAAYTRTIVPI